MPQIAATNDSGILQHAVCDMMIVYVLNKKRNSMEPVLFQRVFIYHKHSTPNIRQQPKYQIKHDTPLERVWGGGFALSPLTESESPQLTVLIPKIWDPTHTPLVVGKQPVRRGSADYEGSVGDKVSKEGHRSSHSPQHRGGLGVIASMCMLVTIMAV